MSKKILTLTWIAVALILTSCSTTQKSPKITPKSKTSTVYQVTPTAPFIRKEAISQLSNRNVANIQGIADYLSSAFFKRHQDADSEDGYLTAYKISYLTTVPNNFGTYIRCNSDKNEKYQCNPKDTYVCKKYVCKDTQDYKKCMRNKCPSIGDDSQIGAAWINDNLTNPVMFFSLPQKAECSYNQALGDNNCTWKTTTKLGSIPIKAILDKHLILKPQQKESHDERQIRIDKNTEMLKSINFKFQ